MTIKNLIHDLEDMREKHGDNTQVYFSVDEEGNDFKPVHEVGDAVAGEGFTNIQSGKEIAGIILWTNE